MGNCIKGSSSEYHSLSHSSNDDAEEQYLPSDHNEQSSGYREMVSIPRVCFI